MSVRTDCFGNVRKLRACPSTMSYEYVVELGIIRIVSNKYLSKIISGINSYQWNNYLLLETVIFYIYSNNDCTIVRIIRIIVLFNCVQIYTGTGIFLTINLSNNNLQGTIHFLICNLKKVSYKNL